MEGVIFCNEETRSQIRSPVLVIRRRTGSILNPALAEPYKDKVPLRVNWFRVFVLEIQATCSTIRIYIASMQAIQWRKLPVSLKELCIDTTLRCGQSFRLVSSKSREKEIRHANLRWNRWSKSEDNIWSCALHGRILSFRQDSTHLHYRAFYPESTTPLTPPSSAPTSTADNDDNTEALIRHYLNLKPNLTDLYKQWSTSDLNFKKKAPRFTGVRILRQDAWEALVGFICSSNNNIIRISQMVCEHWILGHTIVALANRINRWKSYVSIMDL